MVSSLLPRLAETTVLMLMLIGSTAYVWTIAARNKHWVVTAGSFLIIITYAFQPLAAALFNVQDLFWVDPRASLPLADSCLLNIH